MFRVSLSLIGLIGQQVSHAQYILLIGTLGNEDITQERQKCFLARLDTQWPHFQKF